MATLASRALMAVNRVVRPIGISVTSYYLVAQPVHDKPLLPGHRGAGINVRRIERGDLALTTFSRPLREIEYRFDIGAVCFGAFKQDRMLGWAWAQIGEYREAEDRCVIVPCPSGTSAWDLDIYIAEHERMGIIFARLWDELNTYLRQCGVKWTMSRIGAYNAASLASHNRLGARVLSRLWFVNIGAWQLLLATQQPYIHIAGNRSTAPTINVYPPMTATNQ